MKKRSTIILLCLFLLSVSLSAENIRGPVSGMLVLDSLNDRTSVTTRVEHLTGIVIEELSP
ncbi:MAG: hypothetical protein PQJ58_11380, partial [Spirochaetales bacterium]|nr:hypothetical protein [Spirochaetales bacterium]